MPGSNEDARTRGAVPLSSMVDAERARIMSNASPEQRARMEAAEHAREVYRAWNAVCAGTREGEHVTGLRYLPDTNELLVYLDAASWTQEMTMLREIIRARMERAGVRIGGFVFRTSKPGYGGKKFHMVRRTSSPAASAEPRKAASPHTLLTEEEDRELQEAVAPIENRELRESLKKAMKASIEWKKSKNEKNSG